MRTKMVALAVTALVSAASVARADVIYSYTGTAPSPGSYGNAPFVPTLDLTLDITNAAVQSGAFTLDGGSGSSTNPALNYSGDLADWISFSSSSVPGVVTSNTILGLGQFRLALTFDPSTGAVTSTNFESAFDETGDATLTGTGITATGTYGNDYPAYALCDGRTNTCNISGAWTETGYAAASPGNPVGSPVPEPAALVVLGAGVLGLVAARRQISSAGRGDARA